MSLTHCFFKKVFILRKESLGQVDCTFFGVANSQSSSLIFHWNYSSLKNEFLCRYKTRRWRGILWLQDILLVCESEAGAVLHTKCSLRSVIVAGMSSLRDDNGKSSEHLHTDNQSMWPCHDRFSPLKVASKLNHQRSKFISGFFCLLESPCYNDASWREQLCRFILRRWSHAVLALGEFPSPNSPQMGLTRRCLVIVLFIIKEKKQEGFPIFVCYITQSPLVPITRKW